MAFVRALTRAASEVGRVARAVRLIPPPQRKLNQIAHLESYLPVTCLHRVTAEHLLASTTVDRSVVYVPPGIKSPINLPTLQRSWDYNLPSFVKPTTVIGDSKVIAPSTDTNSNGMEKTDPKLMGIVNEKRAVNMLIIRRKKMKKHKLRKLRKRMYALWSKRRYRIEKNKEQVFRAELLAQIHEARAFDAEKFVTGVLDKLRNRPRPETPEERREKLLELMRKHRSNIQYIKPKLD
uniref:Ribosomal protein mS38 C-terminal domain-containing protein n=1 Tax=Rhipicephalus pulchellus TaxID=72859 RepID=L7M2Q3_RHIPC